MNSLSRSLDGAIPIENLACLYEYYAFIPNTACLRLTYLLIVFQSDAINNYCNVI